MTRENKEENCICAVEYDENHEPIKILCKKHREEEEERLRRLYNSPPTKI